ncbi:hypothetical protein HanIR_Chr12g0579321 [Helianthus annuus]|nr:hypothetical protein HanIR_Chr12g0579321 [Helianthus annuus]
MKLINGPKPQGRFWQFTIFFNYLLYLFVFKDVELISSDIIYLISKNLIPIRPKSLYTCLNTRRYIKIVNMLFVTYKADQN